MVFGYEVARDGVRLAEGESIHLVVGPGGLTAPSPRPMLALVRSASRASSGNLRPPGSRRR